MKKILAIAMAVVMIFALSVSVFAEEVVYKMPDDANLGQNLEDVTIGSGTTIPADHDEYGMGARLATNWVNGGNPWNDIIAAIKTEGAVLKITYTGTLTAIVFQSENADQGEAVEVTNVVEVDGKNVAIISCDDLVAAAPVTLGDNFGGWANLIARYEGDIAFYGLEVVTGYDPDAAAEPEATEDEGEPEATEPEAAPEATEPEAAPETAAPAPAAPATGLALAVVPAVMALAAVAVSKKH